MVVFSQKRPSVENACSGLSNRVLRGCCLGAACRYELAEHVRYLLSTT